jgi:uncharacterized protein YndB with AHSA1/START domain
VIEGDAVIHEVLLPVTPEDAFEMFVDPARLVRWIGISADLEPRPGGRFRFEVMPDQFCEGRYVAVDRPHRLVFTWGWVDARMAVPPGTSRVEVTFTPTGNDGHSTALRLIHTGLAADARLLHEDGWTRFLDRLVAVAARHDAAPYPTETPEERRRWLSTS